MSLSKNNSGYVLIFAIVFTAIFMTVSAALLGYSQLQIKAGRQATGKQQALYLAEAGVNKAIDQLNRDGNYSGETNTALSGGTFSVSIGNIDQYNKKITSVGKVAYDGNLIAEKTVEVLASIDISTISFSYGVQAGKGGFVMNNGSVINGNVFSNGSISGGGTVTGDVTVAAGTSAEPDQGWSVQNSEFLFGDTSSRAAVAEKFTPTQTNTLNKVAVKLKKIGAPGNLTLQVVADNGGSPSKTVLASGSISAALVTGSHAFVDGALNATPALTAGQTYWIMLISNISSLNYYSWAQDAASSTGKFSSAWDDKNPVWDSTGGKFNFQTYLGGEVTGISDITIGGTARATQLLTCSIGADAYYESVNSCTVGGALHPATPAPPPAPMPISESQIAAWESAAQAGGTIAGDYVLDEAVATIGPIKIDGNLTVTNNSIVYIAGPVWVSGDIVFSNNVQMSLSPSLGNSGTALIADYKDDPAVKGKIILGNNSALSGNGQLGSYPLFISMYSGNELAIDLSNNADSSIFYAPFGSINVNNNASVKEMTGYRIIMNNNSAVNYESGLQSAHFSSGPGGSWTYRNGTYAVVR